MNELSRFQFNENQVRTVNIDGQIWFVAKDVCEVLGLQNPTERIQGLDNDERAMFNIGRQGEANIISESGLYKLIFKSRKKIAKQFTKWVTSEVLPAIHKSGTYSLPAESGDLARFITDDYRKMIENNAVLKAENRILNSFRPKGKPGDLADNGKEKWNFRRGYYTSGRGRPIMSLLSMQPELPGISKEATI